jgi:uncharacterized membrane protein YphA (DoxX/SURF4 family)
MKIVRLILRLISGSVFIFSGIVKAIDPSGSAFKFHDYFRAFGLDFLLSLTLPLAILLSLAEFITGFSVLTGIKFRQGVTGMFILIAFFTPLTLILALINPVSDCGCFGDAIHLSNWQTFGKNIFLFSIILILYLSGKGLRESFGKLSGWLITLSVSILFILFSLYNLRYLPVIDFLPYKVGNNIPELMRIPEGAPISKYETTFIYEKEGIRKEFTLENYPANDSSWVFIDSRSILTDKGYEPPIHDLSIVSMENIDITETILSNPDYTLLMIARKLNKARRERLLKGFEMGSICLKNGIGFYILTASGSDEINKYDASLKFCHTDETTLKTMIRSNPGYILLKNGKITGKWSWANLPDDYSELKNR